MEQKKTTGKVTESGANKMNATTPQDPEEQGTDSKLAGSLDEEEDDDVDDVEEEETEEEEAYEPDEEDAEENDLAGEDADEADQRKP